MDTNTGIYGGICFVPAEITVTFCRISMATGHYMVKYQCSSAVYSFISSQSHNGVWTKVICVFRRNLAQALEQSPPGSHHCFRDRFPKKKTSSWWCILGDTEAWQGVSVGSEKSGRGGVTFFPCKVDELVSIKKALMPTRYGWPSHHRPHHGRDGSGKRHGDGSKAIKKHLSSLVCGMNITLWLLWLWLH